MERDPQLSAWLVASRREIDRRLQRELGATAPGPASPEAEALRRFRSFAAAALLRGELHPPSLDGLRAPAPQVARLVEAWVRSAAELAGPGRDVQGALEPLARSFATALRGTGAARGAAGAPRRSKRRAVSAAIDRLTEAFLAIDTDSRCIADANPAAGALLGLPRDRLLERDVLGFVPEPARPDWLIHIDAMAEASEPRRFHSQLRNVSGAGLEVEASVTRYATRSRTLALVLARPVLG